MLVQYSGLDFELESIKKYECRAVYSEDGVDFLYHHIRLGMVMVFNPAATQVDRALGPVTVARIKQQMLTPRRLLTVSLGGILFLQSPKNSPTVPTQPMRYDCKTGPNPITFNVIRIDGVRTLTCYWEVETYQNDSIRSNNNQPYLLSHRWEESQSLDPLFYETRIIQGRAVFRNDIMDDRYRFLPIVDQRAALLGRIYADDFRARLFHQPPRDFKLEHSNVKQSSDGTTIDYTLVHKQQPINLKPNTGVVKWAGQWMRGSNVTGMFEFAKYHAALVLRAWAPRQGSRTGLLDAIKKVLPVYGFNVDLGGNTAYFHSSIRMDVFERFCEVNVGFQVGGVGDRLGLSTIDNNIGQFTEDLTVSFPEGDGIITTVTDKQAVPAIGGGTRSAHVRMIPQQPNSGFALPKRPPVGAVRPQNGGEVFKWDVDFTDPAAT